VKTLHISDVVEQLRANSKIALNSDTLKRMAQDRGLSHISYGVFKHENMPASFQPQRITTYPADWISRYHDKSYKTIDPAYETISKKARGVNWEDLRGRTSTADRFFDDARSYGIGPNGFSMPIQWGRCGLSVVSFSGNMKEAEWLKYCHASRLELHIVAYYLHIALSEKIVATLTLPQLTNRQLECLKWAAAGKTTWETSQILNIASTTVEFYLEEAKKKLGAVNKVHAACHAVRLGML
jgi:DNA-binding CsgD family transcriptional regulator